MSTKLFLTTKTTTPSSRELAHEHENSRDISEHPSARGWTHPLPPRLSYIRKRRDDGSESKHDKK